VSASFLRPLCLHFRFMGVFVPLCAGTQYCGPRTALFILAGTEVTQFKPDNQTPFGLGSAQISVDFDDFLMRSRLR